MKQILEIGGKTVTVFCESDKPVPMVYLNTVMGEGEAVWDECKKICRPDFALAAVSGLDWNCDMSPWAAPPVYANDAPFGGGADGYLNTLTEVVHAVNGLLPEKPTYNALAGYSLAGLFALYSLYKTDVFSKIASASGSLWFPNFAEYAKSNGFHKPDCIYFSLGNKESRTKNPLLNTVEDNTKALSLYYDGCGIKTTYVENVGNHLRQANNRMAMGIKWILEN